jgi:two-component system NtrC family sensor kinase
VEDLDFRISCVAAEGNKLKQIFMNLIMNALQATPVGGTLYLRTAGLDTSGVTVQIADTGTGIPPHLLDRIFTPFFTTKDPGEGTGLGLFITKKLMESLGGAINVESTVGEGTIFSLTLPVAE